MPFNSGTQTCENCKRDIPRDAKFCPACGHPTGANMGRCPQCGTQVAANAKFCPGCGRPLTALRDPAVQGSVWRTSPDDFAVCIEADDLRGLNKTIEIRPGQQAVLLVNGRTADETRPPGTYTVQSLFDRLLNPVHGRRVTALVAQSGPMDVDFKLADLRTKDDFTVEAECRLSVEVANAPTFFANVMRGRQTYTLNNLREFLFGQMHDGVQDLIRRYDLLALPDSFTAKVQVATLINQHLERTLGSSGLSVVEVRASNFAHPRYDAVRKVQENIRLFKWEIEADTALTVEQKRAELDRREQLFAVELASEDLETRRQRQEARLAEERAQVKQQMREAVLSDRMNEVNNEEQLAVFLRGVDKNRLIRNDEWERLQREFAERKEDQVSARAHLLARLKLEQESEMRIARGLREHEFSMAQLSQVREQDEYRQLTQMGLEEERAGWDMRMRRQQNEARRAEENAEAAAQRERDLQNQQTQIEMRLREARTQAEIESLEREQDRLDAEMGIALLDKMKVVKRKDEEERMLVALRSQREQAEIVLMAEQRRLEMQLQADRQRHQQEMAMQAQQQKYELDRLVMFSQMGVEALVAASGAEQGAYLVSLARTQALEGKNAEEILAMAAENSPAVAEAFKEKYRALAEGRMSEREQVLYERLVAEQKEVAQTQRQMADEQARRQQELATEALRTQADVAKSFAQSRPASGPTVVIPSGGMAGGYPTVVDQTSASGEVQVCPTCRVKMPVGVKFCTNCGHKFFD